jgi:FixJ family two-component response regulator
MRDYPRMKVHTKSPMVAVVDDDPSMCQAMASLLMAYGLQVEHFFSAEDFLSSVHFDRTDCLVLDIRMDGMSGLELQRELAARARRLPIIFVTAHGSKNQEQIAMRAGAAAFLRKPFSAVQMLRILASTLDMQELDH